MDHYTRNLLITRKPIRRNPRRRMFDHLLGTKVLLVVETWSNHGVVTVSKFWLESDGDAEAAGEVSAFAWEEVITPEAAAMSHALCDIATDELYDKVFPPRKGERSPRVNYLLTQCLRWLCGEFPEFGKVWGRVSVREAEPVIE